MIIHLHWFNTFFLISDFLCMWLLSKQAFIVSSNTALSDELLIPVALFCSDWL